MRGVVLIVGCGSFGLGEAMAAAIRESTVVLLADRAMMLQDPFEVGADLLNAAIMREVLKEPQYARPLPIPAALVERFPVQARPVPRWLPRPREQRTRRAK